MIMTKTMEEKVALVTGSAMGIGLACAEAFAKAGYITVLADIREPGEQVEKLVAEGQKAVADTPVPRSSSERLSVKETT